MHSIHEVITDTLTLRQGYLYRQGYPFTVLKEPNIYDAIIIKNPARCTLWCPGMYRSAIAAFSLEEQIAFIQQHQIEKAIIIAEDISFLPRCPSLRHLSIYPADTAADSFDYSPLYEMPCIQTLVCQTAYGGPETPRKTTVDYARIHGLVDVGISGKGHLNYHQVDTLEELFVSGDKTRRDLSAISSSPNLKRLWLMQCGLKSLEGIGHFPHMQQISLDYMRSLCDISQLSAVAASLRALSIENCPKITDFSVLHELVQLEHLQLYGKNDLPDLSFLRHMKKLKTFVFSMNVLDHDLTPCMQVPYASILRNRKQYNLKDQDLPKASTEPFRLR